MDLLVLYTHVRLLEHARLDHQVACGPADPCRFLQDDRERRVRASQIAYYPIKRPVADCPYWLANYSKIVETLFCKHIYPGCRNFIWPFWRTAWQQHFFVQHLVSLTSSPDSRIVSPVPPYCFAPADVIFGDLDDGKVTLCRSQGSFAGDIQLTFQRSFSYLHYKSLFRHSRPLDAPPAGGETFRGLSYQRMIIVRTEIRRLRDMVLLGHNLVFFN